MKDLKQQLIRLGHERPELRKHLKPILDVVSKVSSKSVAKASKDLYDYLTWEFPEGDMTIKDYWHALSATGTRDIYDQDAVELAISDPPELYVLSDHNEEWVIEITDRGWKRWRT